jgi:hypothetical protein
VEVEMNATQDVLELVVFRLNEGVSRDQFLATNDAVSAWIREQPGFLSRDLSYDADGDRWIDIIRWASLENATTAAERSTSSPSCLPMFALIDMDSLLMLHGEPAIAPVRPAVKEGN